MFASGQLWCVKHTVHLRRSYTTLNYLVTDIRYIKRMHTRTRRTAKEMGENLQTWRKLLDLTAQQVAERAGISRSTLSRLENGEPVGHDAFLSVIRALGIVDRVSKATNPWETDVGRLRADEDLPQRIRRRG